MNWSPFVLSIQVTAIASAGILVIGLALAYLLAEREFRGKLVLETVLNLPLILPPTVVGYFLLLALGRGSFLREVLQVDLLFTWQAATIASVVVGLPLMIQSARAGFEEVDVEAQDAARVDGANAWQIIWYVTIPLAWRGIVAGLALGSARALGEFGATLMIAGNIPGRTQTMPLAIYDAIQARRYDDAGVLVIITTLFAFSVLWGVQRLNGVYKQRGLRLRKRSGSA